MRYLELSDATRLVNASDADFRNMVRAGLLSGARYSQLARLIVQDFDREPGLSV